MKRQEKLSKKSIKLLAAFWVKDERTIRRWVKDQNEMFITHPETIKIISENK